MHNPNYRPPVIKSTVPEMNMQHCNHHWRNKTNDLLINYTEVIDHLQHLTNIFNKELTHVTSQISFIFIYALTNNCGRNRRSVILTPKNLIIASHCTKCVFILSRNNSRSYKASQKMDQFPIKLNAELKKFIASEIYCWNEHPKTIKIENFGCQMLENSKNIAV